MQLFLFDVDETQRIGGWFIIRRFAKPAVDVEVGFCDVPFLY